MLTFYPDGCRITTCAELPRALRGASRDFGHPPFGRLFSRNRYEPVSCLALGAHKWGSIYAKDIFASADCGWTSAPARTRRCLSSGYSRAHLFDLCSKIRVWEAGANQCEAARRTAGEARQLRDEG